MASFTADVALWAGRFGLVLTVFYMLSGVPTALKIVRDRDAKNFSPVPYIIGVFNCSMWAYYSVIAMEEMGQNLWSNLEINIIGLVIFGSYTIPFLAFSRDRTRVIGQLLLSLLATVGSIWIFENLVGDPPKLKWNFHFGGDNVPLKASLCGVLTVTLNAILYGSPLVQLQLVVRTKSVEFMPFGMSLLTFIISCIWTTQGFALGNITVLIPNLLGVLLGAAQLTLYAMYCNNTPLATSVDKPAKLSSESSNLEETLLGA